MLPSVGVGDTGDAPRRPASVWRGIRATVWACWQARLRDANPGGWRIGSAGLRLGRRGKLPLFPEQQELVQLGEHLGDARMELRNVCRQGAGRRSAADSTGHHAGAEPPHEAGDGFQEGSGAMGHVIIIH